RILRQIQTVQCTEEVGVRHLSKKLFDIAGVVDGRTIDIPDTTRRWLRRSQYRGTIRTIRSGEWNHVAVWIELLIAEHAEARQLRCVWRAVRIARRRYGITEVIHCYPGCRCR